MSPLQNAPAPLGVNSEFISPNPTALLLKEEVMSLSGDSFHVVSLPEGSDNPKVTGPPLFQIKGDKMSLSKRKHFLTEAGAMIYDVRKEHLSIMTNFYAEDEAGKKVWELDGKISLGSSKSVCKFVGVDGKEHQLLIKGNWLDSKAEITDEATGEPVARIIRNKWNMRDLMFGQQTYVVEVAGNVDACLIAAMCVCLDERQNEKKDDSD